MRRKRFAPPARPPGRLGGECEQATGPVVGWARVWQAIWGWGCFLTWLGGLRRDGRSARREALFVTYQVIIKHHF